MVPISRGLDEGVQDGYLEQVLAYTATVGVTMALD